MDEKVKSERRKILAEAVKSAKKALGIDVAKLALIQDQFDKRYDKLLPNIAQSHMDTAEKNSKAHLKILADRYAAAKKGIFEDRVTTLYPRCWCDFLDDFSTTNICDHTIPVQDVDAANHLDVDFDCISAENKAKPYVMLRGGGDGVTNTVQMVSRIAFNIDNSKLTTKGKYCLSPTTFLSGYWLKENWAGCEGVTSTGDFNLKLKITATQLGGTKLLGELETTVFDWSSSAGYTGVIDQTYNVSGSTTSKKFVLYPEIDPADGDVFVEIKLDIFMSMTAYGRFLVDLKNSSSFYFWVERLELAKHKCLPIFCIIGGPDSEVHCKIGGPDTVCKIGGPGTVVCKTGGPYMTPICQTGGPDTPIPICKTGPELGCPAGPEVGCLAGPPLDVVFDPEMWEKGIITVELEKIPQSMRRSIIKMVEQIKKDQ